MIEAANVQKAIEVLKRESKNKCFSKEFRDAMKTAVEAMEEMSVTKGGHVCEYYSNGRCVAQKGTPKCTPCDGSCPYDRGHGKV